MNSSYVNALARTSEAVSVKPGSTSYFSAHSDELDPGLFDGTGLRPSIRSGILQVLFKYLAQNYVQPERWTSAWLAGSGVSYQWESQRMPGDLDCLVGIDYSTFRQLNDDYAGMSNAEIASLFNEGFNEHLMPKTRNWHSFELTFYVNQASDIRDINPYAAYDLINDEWTVEPHHENPPYSRAWESRTHSDYKTGVDIVNRYSQALNDVKAAVNPAHRANAETRLRAAVEQAVAVFEDIHAGRKIAFSPVGAGYADFNNYRWQSGKRTGIIPALRQIKDYHDAAITSEQLDTYGVELPTAETMVRRAAARRYH